jgi:hypothetical protein
MRRRLSLVPRVRTLQYVLVAVVAFSLGGATVVQAVAPGGITGVVQLADRTDNTRLAAVDANGNVQVKVNNLAATQQISGTVSVDNFPATQKVNVTGGTVLTKSSVATRSGAVNEVNQTSNTNRQFEFDPPINVAFIVINTSDNLALNVFGPFGVFFLTIHSEDKQIVLAQRIPINRISVFCANISLPCTYHMSLVGD